MILKNYNIIAVTTSPRRISLLKKTFLNIKFIKPLYEEKSCDFFLSPLMLSKRIALNKMKGINGYDKNILVTFDTLVYRNFKIYNKPQNKEIAVRFLKELSDKRHKVITSICIKTGDDLKVYSSISTVKFKKLSFSDILKYIKTDEWKDKAGGYGIQGHGKDLVEWYKGDYYNIVGIPINMLVNIIKII